MVSNDSGIESVEDLVKLAAERPIVVGLPGSLGNVAYLSGSMLEAAGEVQLNYVPFSGGAPARLALLGGHVSVALLSTIEVYSDARSGSLKILATTGVERSPLTPDVPTMKELGYEVEIGSLAGFAAPAGLPDDIRAKLSEAFVSALSDPGYIKEATERELAVAPMDADAFTTALNSYFETVQGLWAAKPWK
ncbi:tripartite tricarboxylate transporter substrate-binding protein [Devosia sp. A449]